MAALKPPDSGGAGDAGDAGDAVEVGDAGEVVDDVDASKPVFEYVPIDIDAKPSTEGFGGDGLLKAYEELLELRRDLGTAENLQGVKILQNIGKAKSRRKDLRGALGTFEEARRICGDTGEAEEEESKKKKKKKEPDEDCPPDLLESPEAVSLLLNIGTTKSELEDLEGALESLEKAKRICEETNMTETITGESLMTSLEARIVDVKSRFPVEEKTEEAVEGEEEEEGEEGDTENL